MKLSELFDKENIVLDVSSENKDEALKDMLGYLDSRGLVRDLGAALDDVIEREKVMSTGIGNGVAIPHAYTEGVDKLVAAFFRTRKPIDFEALDGKDVDLYFIILGPKESRRDHIKVLAKISRLLNHEEFRSALREAKGADEVYGIFRKFGDR